MGWFVAVSVGLLAGSVLLWLLLREPAGAREPPFVLVRLADRHGLQLQGWSAAGRVGRQYVHLDLIRTPRRFGYRRDRRVRLRIDGPAIRDLTLRERRVTDALRGVRVDQGRFDEGVMVEAADPRQALSRLGGPARAAVLRAVQLGARFEDGVWTLDRPGAPDEAPRLLRALLAAADAVDAEGSVAGRLEHNARRDPVLEVRVSNAAARLGLPGLGESLVRELAAVLREGLDATPPVAGAREAMDRLRGLRSAHEVGRVSLPDPSGGALALTEPEGGELALGES